MSVNIDSESANIPSIALTDQGSDIAAPSAGYVQFYTKSGAPYFRTSTGILVPVVNPMTTQDDLIVGGASGVPGRLAKGTDGQVLTVDPTTHHLLWATPASGAIATDAIWDAAGDDVQGTGANTAARLAIGTAFQMQRVNAGATAREYAGGLSLITRTVVGAGGVASVDWQSIPADFNDLLVVWEARSDTSATSTALIARCNNDSGANYHSEWYQAIGTTNGPNESIAATDAIVGNMAAANATAARSGAGTVWIPNYKRTTFHKRLNGTGSLSISALTGGQFAYIFDGMWANTAAINRLTLLASAGNLVEGSVFSLYGLS